MPRPRVPPADRQRAPKACVTCKVSKKRCDANLPCALCVRKGRAESCTYPDVDEKGRSSRSRSPRTSPQPPRGRGVLGPDTFTRASRLRERELESESVTRESSPQCSQRPTMLLSSRGEQGSLHLITSHNLLNVSSCFKVKLTTDCYRQSTLGMLLLSLFCSSYRRR